MENHKIKYIQSGNLQIAASCETTSGKTTEVYHPATLLVYVHVGTLHIDIGENTLVVPRGEFCILRKYTEATIYKTWTEQEGMAKTYGFALTNEFIEKVIHKVKVPKNGEVIGDSYFKVPKTKELDELMQSLIVHIDGSNNIEDDVIESKTLEALRAFVEIDNTILQLLKEFSKKERANLEKLMNHNFLYKIPLHVFAKQAGRSLSTFNRDFRIIFNDSPHRWIMKKRLYFARDLMKQNKLKASQVYLDSGFEDLAHFSRAFKNQFKITPSAFYKSIR